jgi:putative copper export protein
VFEGLGNAVHLIAAVVWIGGLALLVVGLRPVASKALPDDAAREALESPLYRRFFKLALLAAAVLLASGLMMMASDTHFEGFGRYGNTWSKLMVAKHALFVVMIGVLAFMRRARPVKNERDLLDVSLMLGVAVLVVTGLLTGIPE